MIDSSYFWQNIFFLALGTIAIRGSIIAISGKVKISERLRELFSFIPAAILPAFIAPAVFYHQGQVEWAFHKERLIVLVFATALCIWTRNTLITVVCGLVALYAMTSI